MLFWKLDVTLWNHRTVLTKLAYSLQWIQIIYSNMKKTTRKTNEQSMNLDAVIRQLYPPKNTNFQTAYPIPQYTFLFWEVEGHSLHPNNWSLSEAAYTTQAALGGTHFIQLFELFRLMGLRWCAYQYVFKICRKRIDLNA